MLTTPKKCLCFLHKPFCTSNINRDTGRLFCNPKAWLWILYLNNSPFSWSFTAQLHYQMSHLQKPKSQNKSWGVAAKHGLERLQKVTGARQTAQNSSRGSQASSSPRAQRGSQLISCLLCRREAVGNAQCCILICASLWSLEQKLSPECSRAHYPAETNSPEQRGVSWAVKQHQLRIATSLPALSRAQEAHAGRDSLAAVRMEPGLQQGWNPV